MTAWLYECDCEDACVQAVEVEMHFGLGSDEAHDRMVVLRRMLRDARGDTSFGSVVRADAAIVATLGHSVAASAAHIASEEAAMGEHGVCPHTHLEEWHGAAERFHCKRCKAAVTDAARVQHERRRADEVRAGSKRACVVWGMVIVTSGVCVAGDCRGWQ